jgi:RimJ/RimL family protein N-acetyltransferase
METPSLAGRPVSQDDLPFVTAVWNDGRVAPTIGGQRTEQQLSDRIQQWTEHWSGCGFGATLFQERATALPVGWGGLQRSTIGIGECLTVGYVIAPDVWGRGYATEIAVASIAHAFDVLGAPELYASVLSTNAASRRVLEKAGLSLHREIDHDNHVEVIYVIRQ